MFRIINNKKQQKQILKIYQKQLLKIQEYYNSNKYLNQKQKDRLDYFLNRSISFCKNNKKVKYNKNHLKNNSETRIKNKSQYRVYRKIYEMLVMVSREINADFTLNNDNKVKLMRYVSFAVGHVRGKMNCSKSW